MLDVSDLTPEPAAAAAEADAAPAAPAFDPANANAPVQQDSEPEAPPLPDDPGVDPKDARRQGSASFPFVLIVESTL